MKKLFLTFLISTILVSCKQEKQLNTQDIINSAIEVSGGAKFEVSTIAFDFRDKHYVAKRNNGMYQYERHFKGSTGIIKDVLSNDGFQRFVNDVLIKVADTMAPKYSRSVNSVHYFSVLPFGLNDVAVNKKLLSEVLINEKAYHKIKVTFNQEGGGDDFEDVFVYWIAKEGYKVNYLAYSYLEDNGELGLRFREAYNERFVNGIRFVDYNNYKPKNKEADLLDLDNLFENGKLKLLSKIENKNVVVK
ncbi:MAG: deoxyribose-phosphate aldolase [Flavobacteriaceae bacterium]|nr:deoxyribose-phosphate aldolase [Flavobacteriaceae bacterium]